MKTILVTSLNPKDGKTSCALGLAKSLNDQGYKSTCIELFNSNKESSQTSFIKELHPNEIGSFPYSINLENKNKIIEDINKFNDTTDYLIIDTLSLSDTSQEIAEFLLEIPESSIIIIIKLETSDSITTIREKLNAASTIVPKNIRGVMSNGEQFNTYAPEDPNLIQKLSDKGVSI